MKHFNSLEAACRELDMKVASTLARSEKGQGEKELGRCCQEYIQALRAATHLEEQAASWHTNAEHLQEQLAATMIEVGDNDHPLVELLSESLQESTQKSKELVSVHHSQFVRWWNEYAVYTNEYLQ